MSSISISAGSGTTIVRLSIVVVLHSSGFSSLAQASSYWFCLPKGLSLRLIRDLPDFDAQYS
jgi:hypothetical protein